MPRLSRSKVFRLLIAAILAAALMLGIRAVLEGERPQSLNPNTVQQMMDGPPPGDAGVEMSEKLASDHPFIYAGIHLEKIYELNLNSRTFRPTVKSGWNGVLLWTNSLNSMEPILPT